MNGLDTNVLVRFIMQDDAAQSALAAKFIEKECSPESPGFITLITLVETVWVLESCYDVQKQGLIDLLNRILSVKQLVVQEQETAWQALHLFQNEQADFADCLIEKIALNHGCKKIVTFDKTAAKAGMTLLK